MEYTSIKELTKAVEKYILDNNKRIRIKIRIRIRIKINGMLPFEFRLQAV